MDLLKALGIFLISFSFVLLLRKRIGKDYEIKNTDILIGLVPLALWLLLTGKITSFEYGDLKIATAFNEANNKPIAETITKIYKSNLNSAEKGSLYELEQILASKPEALIFHSGQYRYSPDVIEEYLRKLSASTLQYLIVKELNDDFAGMVSVNQFLPQALSENRSITPQQFADWLNTGNNERLSSITGYISKAQALPENATKISALEQIEKLNTRFLPVLSGNKFAGIIERDQLSTSLLMDVSKSLSK